MDLIFKDVLFQVMECQYNQEHIYIYGVCFCTLSIDKSYLISTDTEGLSIDRITYPRICSIKVRKHAIYMRPEVNSSQFEISIQGEILRRCKVTHY